MVNHMDPVCDMQVDEGNVAGLAERDGATYYFDREGCMSKFNQHPEKYAEEFDKQKLSDRASDGGRGFQATKAKNTAGRRLSVDSSLAREEDGMSVWTSEGNRETNSPKLET